MKNRKKTLIIAIICLAAAAVLYLLVVKLSQRSEDADSSDDSLVISSVAVVRLQPFLMKKTAKVSPLGRRTAPGIMRRTRVFRLTRTA